MAEFSPFPTPAVALEAQTHYTSGCPDDTICFFLLVTKHGSALETRLQVQQHIAKPWSLSLPKRISHSAVQFPPSQLLHSAVCSALSERSCCLTGGGRREVCFARAAVIPPRSPGGFSALSEQRQLRSAQLGVREGSCPAPGTRDGKFLSQLSPARIPHPKRGQTGSRKSLNPAFAS